MNPKFLSKMIINVALALVVPSLASAVALIDPALTSFLNTDQSKKVKVVALMAYAQNGIAVPYRYNHQGVRQYLYTQTQRAWKDVATQAQNAHVNLNGSDIKIFSVHWINNSLVAEVTPNGLKQLANLSTIQKVYFNNRMVSENPFKGRRRLDTALSGSALPYDLLQMKMDQVYLNFPQITGQGVLVGHIDTGVDGKHPALAGRIQTFWNAATQKVEPATDAGEHGTHTAGSILGVGPGGAPMGVAPGAKLISAAALGSYAEMIKAMEFMLDPDSNPNTADFPRLVSNSWNCEGAPDLEVFYRAISAWEAAGILPVFSAGNAGPRTATITKPHEHPASLAVAALDQNAKVASFSSRGPGKFNGQATQKPDISGPGVDVVSSVPGGKYESMSGTSMSTPHIAGLVALVLQANPNLNPAQIREIITRSAVYVDEQGVPQAQQKWNASFGLGIADAFAAIKMATSQIVGPRTAPHSVSPIPLVTQWEPSLVDVVTPVIPLATDIATPFVTDESHWIKL